MASIGWVVFGNIVNLGEAIHMVTQVATAVKHVVNAPNPVHALLEELKEGLEEMESEAQVATKYLEAVNAPTGSALESDFDKLQLRKDQSSFDALLLMADGKKYKAKKRPADFELYKLKVVTVTEDCDNIATEFVKFSVSVLRTKSTVDPDALERRIAQKQPLRPGLFAHSRMRANAANFSFRCSLPGTQLIPRRPQAVIHRPLNASLPIPLGDLAANAGGMVSVQRSVEAVGDDVVERTSIQLSIRADSGAVTAATERSGRRQVRPAIALISRAAPAAPALTTDASPHIVNEVLDEPRVRAGDVSALANPRSPYEVPLPAASSVESLELS